MIRSTENIFCNGVELRRTDANATGLDRLDFIYESLTSNLLSLLLGLLLLRGLRPRTYEKNIHHSTNQIRR